MKNFFYLAVLLAAISCNSNANEPDPSLIAKYQSPFGADTVEVKLKKVTYNGNLLMEYVYTKGYLTGFKKYVAFSKPRFFSTGTFTRNAGVAEKFEVLVAESRPETEYVADKQDPRKTFQFAVPLTDSTRKVSEQDFFTSATLDKTYKFNKQGYFTQQSVSSSTGDSYVVNYTRDSENNVDQTWKVKKSQTLKTDLVDYEYDTHPNPFYNLGIDWEGDFSNYAISPNNISKETVYNAENKGLKSTFVYEYLPNGYPKKITITRGFITVDGVEQTAKPIVLLLEYY